MEEVRLQKFLAECGISSRRGCELMIREGKVLVNGQVAQLGQQITPGVDRIVVGGKDVSSDEKVYIVLNKPSNVITTVRDTHGRKTVMDYLEGVDERVFPVGRLDSDVEGVLLFTNDGDLAFRLMHPRFQITKTYMAWVKGRVGEEALKRLEHGVQLEDGMTAPAKATVLQSGGRTTLLKLVLHEGKKREVKRMCDAVGHPVEKLHRVAFANIRVKGLRPGEWRRLSGEEVKQLYHCVGLKDIGPAVLPAAKE